VKTCGAINPIKKQLPKRLPITEAPKSTLGVQHPAVNLQKNIVCAAQGCQVGRLEGKSVLRVRIPAYGCCNACNRPQGWCDL